MPTVSADVPTAHNVDLSSTEMAAPFGHSKVTPISLAMTVCPENIEKLQQTPSSPVVLVWESLLTGILLDSTLGVEKNSGPLAFYRGKGWSAKETQSRG